MEIQAAQAKTLLHSIFIVLTVACPTSRCQGLGHMTTHKVTRVFFCLFFFITNEHRTIQKIINHLYECTVVHVQVQSKKCPNTTIKIIAKKRMFFYSTSPHGQTWMKDKKIILITN